MLIAIITDYIHKYIHVQAAEDAQSMASFMPESVASSDHDPRSSSPTRSVENYSDKDRDNEVSQSVSSKRVTHTCA